MNLRSLTLLRAPTVAALQSCGMKYFPPPPKYPDFEMPERQKLRFLEKVPQYPPMIKPPKYMKRLKFMMGPEEVHNTLIHRQYGIMALTGGRLKYGHMEMIRLTVGRKIDTTRMFAAWRIDAPWQSVTKKGQGQRMGGGKSAIDHYVTPVKAGRIIVEVAGKCEFAEVKDFLEDLAMKMPFKAMAVSQQILDERKQKEIDDERDNVNPYTMKYVIQNNMGGCHRKIRPNDFKYFGKYI